MKYRSPILAVVLALVLSSCSPSSPPPYTNTPITDTYTFQNSPALTLTASYPHFEDDTYAPLRSAISAEVELWRELYDQLYEQVADECEKDPEFAHLKRYIEADYTVEATDEEVAVTFEVQYYSGGNTEPSYTKTFTFDLESRMVYETFTQTQRVY